MPATEMRTNNVQGQLNGLTSCAEPSGTVLRLVLERCVTHGMLDVNLIDTRPCIPKAAKKRDVDACTPNKLAHALKVPHEHIVEPQLAARLERVLLHVRALFLSAVHLAQRGQTDTAEQLA